MKKRYFLVFLALLVIPIQEVIADNQVTKVIKVTGSLTGGVEDEDFLLPESVDNQNKTLIFMSVRHNADSQAKQIYRSWDFVNNTAIRFHGSNNVPADNLPMDFIAYLVEFTPASDMIVQNGTLIVDGADVDMEFVATLSPTVNQTNTFFTFDGLTMDHSDLSWGAEEFAIMRVINDTSWGYEPFDAPDSGDTEVRFSVTDWNNSGFLLQNGTGSLVSGEATDTITPSPAVDPDHTMILITTQIDAELDATSDEHGVTATFNLSDDLVIQRDDSMCPVANCIVNYRYELITFPTTFANVTHGEIDSTISSPADTPQSTIDIFSPAVTNFNNSIAIGTVQTPFGLGNGRDSSGSAGSWDRVAYTIELLNTTAVNGTTNNGQETPNIAYQVIEFLSLAGQTFDQDISDVVTAVDVGTENNVTKSSVDTATVLDTVSTDIIFVVNVDDNATVTDITSINVTKLAEDAVSVGDDPTFSITKLISDVASVIDSTIVTRTTDVGILDTVTPADTVVLNITKQADDTATVVDTVDITRILELFLNDTATVSDPSILFTISTVVPNGTGTGTGASTGGGTPSFQRIVGLSITSELFFVDPADRVPSDFLINTFGRDTTTTTLTNIEADQQFQSWFNFGQFPTTLDFDTTVDTTRTINDPARYKNLALQDFVLTVPQVSCSELDTFASPVPCIDPIVYEAPVTFTFKKGGVEFRERHIVTVDATTPVVCDEICQLVNFITENWWWLAGIVVVFMMMYFLGGAIKNRGLRTVRRIDTKQFTSFDASKPRRKFKRRG